MNFNPVLRSSTGPPDDAGGAGPAFALHYPLRILIADDNYINRRVLSLLLQRLGYQVDTTENGQDCLTAALSTTYDLLLLDLNMPNLSGIECAQQLRKAGRKFAIVAVTATDPDVNRKLCLAAGMNDFVCKPLQLPELKRVLRETSERANTPAVQPKRAEEGGASGHSVGYPILHFAL